MNIQRMTHVSAVRTLEIFFPLSFFSLIRETAAAAVFPSLSLVRSFSFSPVQRIINTALEWRMIDSYANRNLIIERCIHAKLIVLTGRQKKYEKTRLPRKGVGGKRGN